MDQQLNGKRGFGQRLSGWFWRGKRKWISLVVLLCVGGGGAFATMHAGGDQNKDKAAGPKPLEFIASELTTLQKISLTQALQISGTLVPSRMVTVRARTSGEIKQLSLREGDNVQSGQVLAQIDAAEVRARMVQAEGALVQAKAALDIAEKNRTNNQRLLNQNFISKNAFDAADSNYVQALGNYKTAQGQADVARIALNDAAVRAPIGGTINKRHVQAGDKVTMEAPLFTLVDVSTLELNAMVPTSDIARVSPGMQVKLTVEGNAGVVSGTIDRVAASAEPGTRAIAIVVSLDNSAQKLRGGMFASGSIQTAPTEPLNTLPAAALRQEGADSFVWVFDGSKLIKQKVQLGRRDENTNQVEVTSPLPAQLQILAGKYDGLKEGTSAVLVKERTTDNSQQMKNDSQAKGKNTASSAVKANGS